MSLLCICPPSCYKEANCLDMLICQHEIVKYFMQIFSLAPLENLEIWKHLFFFCSTSIWSWQPWETLQNCVHTYTHTHTHTCACFPGGTSGKEPTSNAGDRSDTVSIPGLGRSPGGGHGNPLQNSSLGNPMNREAWQTTDHRVAKSQTWLRWLT